MWWLKSFRCSNNVAPGSKAILTNCLQASLPSPPQSLSLSSSLAVQACSPPWRLLESFFFLLPLKRCFISWPPLISSPLPAKNSFILNSKPGIPNSSIFVKSSTTPRISRSQVPPSNSGFLTSAIWPTTLRTSSTTSTPRCCDASCQRNLRRPPPPPPPPPPPERYGVSSLLAVLVSPLVMLHSMLAWGPRLRISPTAWKKFPLAKPNWVWKRLQEKQILLGKERPPLVCSMCKVGPAQSLFS